MHKQEVGTQIADPTAQYEVTIATHPHEECTCIKCLGKAVITAHADHLKNGAWSSARPCSERATTARGSDTADAVTSKAACSRPSVAKDCVTVSSAGS